MTDASKHLWDICTYQLLQGREKDTLTTTHIRKKKEEGCWCSLSDHIKINVDDICLEYWLNNGL